MPDAGAGRCGWCGDCSDAITMQNLLDRGAEGARCRLGGALALGHPGRHLHLHLHVGTTGPPKGCIISHGNYRSMCDMALGVDVLEQGEITYLFLPLAHSFALLIQLLSFSVGGTIAYWERDPLKIVPNLAEVKPTYFPSVPRIFEKIYTAATSAIEKEGGLKKTVFDWAIGVGKKVRALERQGKRPGPLLSLQHKIADKQVLSKIRGAVRRQPEAGGHRRGADQPRDPRVLRRRRPARGRGLGDDRDLNRGDDLDRRGLQVGHGRQAVPRLPDQDRRGRRDPGQGPERLPGLLQERGGDPRDDRRRLAAHRRHRRDRLRGLRQDHRPQEGHHHHRGRQEHHPGEPRGRDQAAPARLADAS